MINFRSFDVRPSINLGTRARILSLLARATSFAALKKVVSEYPPFPCLVLPVSGD